MSIATSRDIWLDGCTEWSHFIQHHTHTHMVVLQRKYSVLEKEDILMRLLRAIVIFNDTESALN